MKNPKLLLIENEEATRDTLTSLLRRRGYAIISCHSLEEADRHMARHPDISGIISEWEVTCPRGKSEEASEVALWAEARAIPVIYYSFAGVHGIKEGLFLTLSEAYGVETHPEFTYVAKPYLSYLMQTVQVLMPLRTYVPQGWEFGPTKGNA